MSLWWRMGGCTKVMARREQGREEEGGAQGRRRRDGGREGGRGEKEGEPSMGEGKEIEEDDKR